LLRLHRQDFVQIAQFSAVCAAPFWQAVEIAQPALSGKKPYGKSQRSRARNLLRRGSWREVDLAPLSPPF